MKVTLEIRCDNAAFNEGGYGPGYEVARILERLAGEVRDYLGDNVLMDGNGNRVGYFAVFKEGSE